MVFAGILAGGVGSRMGNYNIPKQFLPINDRPIIVHVAEKFLLHNEVDLVIMGINPAWYQNMLDIQAKYLSEFKNLVVVKGGNDRNETIDAVIKEARRHSQDDEDIIVTHDAVRPFVTLKMISDNIAAARQFGVCDTVIPATDTIVYSDNGSYITDIPVRSQTYQGQTPQSFKISLFEQVYSSMTQEELNVVTDACKMFMLKGYHVQLVEGHVSNIKITYPYDYKVAQIMMENIKND
ncbi:MAG: 2-C-methyl-D-erythritol 4-phosphate cytidylyltransferase [Oscillospiraceae bacterium]|nr:2-C-methyl-D-erythritol 4-phosphate cytidylyltransferase [Oscillospiraceae bacterium]